MQHRQFVRNRPERRRHVGFSVLVVLAVGFITPSITTGEQQPPSATLSEGYKDPANRREHMFTESRRGVRRTRERHGFTWAFHPSEYVPREYAASARPKLHLATVYTSGTATNATGQTVQLRGRAGLLVTKGKVRSTDRFRIRYRHDFIEQAQRFHSVATGNLTYFGDFADRSLGEFQVFLSTKPDIPEDFLNRLEQKFSLGDSINRHGSVIVTIMQPDGIDGAPLPPDPIPEPIEIVAAATSAARGKVVKVPHRYLPEELHGAQIYSLTMGSRVARQFWDDDKHASIGSLRLFRNRRPGLIHVVLNRNRRRPMDVSKPRGPNNPNSSPFLAENASLTELKIVGALKTLTLRGRYKDDRMGLIIIPPTEATLLFMDSLEQQVELLLELFLTFELE